MKMKKLTALALAGVLCLGMSTTAFASQSPVPADAVNEQDKGKINNADAADYVYQQWGVQEGETQKEATERIQRDVDTQIATLEAQIPYTKSEDQKNYMKKQISELEKIQGKKLEFVSAADITYNGDPTGPVTVRFNLTGKMTDKDKVTIMHEVVDEVTGQKYWTALCDQDVLKKDDPENPGQFIYYVDYDFNSFSNVVIFKQNSDGSSTPLPSDPTKPTDPTNPTDPTVTPDANGNITADQLADLIVKKIESRINTTKVVRTAASGKASPKTGE